ncbi:MAG: hypothetical protein ABIQ11_07080 [Saprospiraceae bacterium]
MSLWRCQGSPPSFPITRLLLMATMALMIIIDFNYPLSGVFSDNQEVTYLVAGENSLQRLVTFCCGRKLPATVSDHLLSGVFSDNKADLVAGENSLQLEVP